MKRGLSDTISVEFYLMGCKSYAKMRSLDKLANIYHPDDKYFLVDFTNDFIFPLSHYRGKNKQSCFTRLNDKVQTTASYRAGLYTATRVVLYDDKSIFHANRRTGNAIYGISIHPKIINRWSEIFDPGYIDIFLESNIFTKTEYLEHIVIPQLGYEGEGKNIRQINYLEKRKIDILRRKE